MSRTKIALSVMFAAALGLAWASVVSAETPAKQKQADEPTWDMGGPPARAVAFDDRDQPPGPPPGRRGEADEDRRGPPPPDGRRCG